MRIFRFPEVVRLTGLSRATIYRLEQNGSFPARIKLSQNAVGWNSDDVEAWMIARMNRSASEVGIDGGKP